MIAAIRHSVWPLQVFFVCVHTCLHIPRSHLQRWPAVTAALYNVQEHHQEEQISRAQQLVDANKKLVSAAAAEVERVCWEIG